MTQKDEIILIPEGEYELMYECHETSYYIGGDAKVAVWFQIVDHSEYYGTSLARHYNAKKLTICSIKNTYNGLKQQVTILSTLFAHQFPS